MFLKSILSAGALVALSAGAGHALTFNWEFDVTRTDSGVCEEVIDEVCFPELSVLAGVDMLGVVRGTISGLDEGSNDGMDLVIEVTSTPDGSLLGGGWTFGGTSGRPGDPGPFLLSIADVAFEVTNGEVTFADARYERAGGDTLYFGTQPLGATFFPELSDQNLGGFFGPGLPTRFTRVGGPPPPSEVPLPAGLPLLALALAGLGVARRRG